ncbi:TetR/AcrR family transcriptional regulator C-terminal ligand-binding domain-containing protein [Mycobacterium sp. SVM_VP21]|nr:TetR/AcrR family transcriptional regulator C-terminal ligand-binding domain-containing protein [Mycobacterium sp. SVM_VP21]
MRLRFRSCIVLFRSKPIVRFNGRRAAITELWHRSVNRGDVDADIAIDDIIDLLSGPLIFRPMTGQYPLAEDHARRLAEVALRGVLAPNAPHAG